MNWVRFRGSFEFRRVRPAAHHCLVLTICRLLRRAVQRYSECPGKTPVVGLHPDPDCKVLTWCAANLGLLAGEE
jgi:hypothetical protein